MTEGKATARALDFTNVKEGSGFNKRRLPAGDYVAKIIKVEDSPSKKDNEPQWLFHIQIQDHKTHVLPYYCKLVENQLWKLRTLLQACGITVPKKRVKLDPERIVGKLIGVTLEDDEYDDKLQSTIAGIFPAKDVTESNLPPEDDDDDDDDDEDEAPPPRKKSKPAPVEDDDEDEDEDEEEAPPVKKKTRKPEPEPEEDDEDEDEEPAPPARKKKAKPVEDDDLDELDLDDL